MVERFFLRSLQGFNQTKSSELKVEETLHTQYLLSIELVGWIYTSEDVAAKEEPSLVAMVQESIVSLTNEQLIDTFSQQLLRSLANNEDSAKTYFSIDFVD